jgi:hypothetical protein
LFEEASKKQCCKVRQNLLLFPTSLTSQVEQATAILIVGNVAAFSKIPLSMLMHAAFSDNQNKGGE